MYVFRSSMLIDYLLETFHNRVFSAILVHFLCLFIFAQDMGPSMILVPNFTMVPTPSLSPKLKGSQTFDNTEESERVYRLP